MIPHVLRSESRGFGGHPLKIGMRRWRGNCRQATGGERPEFWSCIKNTSGSWRDHGMWCIVDASKYAARPYPYFADFDKL
jgi:hypothetical protein